MIAAAGNQGADACTKSPAHLASVITVGASTQNDRPWSGSNRGRCVDLWAPGKGISSVLADGGVLAIGRSALRRGPPVRHRRGRGVPAGSPTGATCESAALAEADRDCWCPSTAHSKGTEPFALCRSSVITVRTCIGYSPPASPRSIPTT